MNKFPLDGLDGWHPHSLTSHMENSLDQSKKSISPQAASLQDADADISQRYDICAPWSSLLLEPCESTSQKPAQPNSADSVASFDDDVDSLSDLSSEKSDDGDDDSVGGDPSDPALGGKRRRSKSAPKSSEQKARAKNREHAKNTRIRKKNYIEALKEAVKFHADEREKIDRDRRIALSRLAEQTNVRKQVLQTMFYFRAITEMDPVRWSTILDDNFTLIMPVTPYRSFPPSQVKNGQRHVKGMEGILADTASLAVLVNSVGNLRDDGQSVRIQYYSEPEEGIMNGDTYMSKWLMRTENAVERGARQEVYKHGMIKALYSPQNKLVTVELAFDVMSFMQHLRRSSGRYDFQVVPNTLSIAREPAQEARVITETSEPFRVVHVNQAWSNLLGYSIDEVVGKPLTNARWKMIPLSLSPGGFGAPAAASIAQETDAHVAQTDRLEGLFRHVRAGRAGAAVITQFTRTGEKMTALLRAFPLFSDGVASHYLSTFEPVESDSALDALTDQSSGMGISSVSVGAKGDVRGVGSGGCSGGGPTGPVVQHGRQEIESLGAGPLVLGRLGVDSAGMRRPTPPRGIAGGVSVVTGGGMGGGTFGGGGAGGVVSGVGAGATAGSFRPPGRDDSVPVPAYTHRMDSASLRVLQHPATAPAAPMGSMGPGPMGPQQFQHQQRENPGYQHHQQHNPSHPSPHQQQQRQQQQQAHMQPQYQSHQQQQQQQSHHHSDPQQQQYDQQQYFQHPQHPLHQQHPVPMMQQQRRPVVDSYTHPHAGSQQQQQQQQHYQGVGVGVSSQTSGSYGVQVKEDPTMMAGDPAAFFIDQNIGMSLSAKLGDALLDWPDFDDDREGRSASSFPEWFRHRSPFAPVEEGKPGDQRDSFVDPSCVIDAGFAGGGGGSVAEEVIAPLAHDPFAAESVGVDLEGGGGQEGDVAGRRGNDGVEVSMIGGEDDATFPSGQVRRL